MGASEKDPTTAPSEDVRRLSDEQRTALSVAEPFMDEEFRGEFRGAFLEEDFQHRIARAIAKAWYAGHMAGAPSELEQQELAWGLIANAHGGDWSLATDEWKQAAERWRDSFLGPRTIPGMDPDIRKETPITPSPEDVSRCASWSATEAEDDGVLWHEEHPDEGLHVCAIPDPQADDCPAYTELSRDLRDLRGSIDNLVSTTTQQESRLDDLAGRVMVLDGRVTTEEAAGHVVAEMLKKAAAVEPSIDEAMIAADKRLEELDNDVAGLGDRLSRYDVVRLEDYRRAVGRLETLESERRATSGDLPDILARLEALETFLSEQKGEDYRRVVGRIDELEYQLFNIRESLRPAAERCQPDPGEPASAGNAADQKLDDEELAGDSEPPRADAAERRILRLTRNVERMEPGARTDFYDGWSVSHRGKAMGLRRCWKLNGPGDYSAIHFQAADAVLAWLNRRAER